MEQVFNNNYTTFFIFPTQFPNIEVSDCTLETDLEQKFLRMNVVDITKYGIIESISILTIRTVLGYTASFSSSKAFLSFSDRLDLFYVQTMPTIDTLMRSNKILFYICRSMIGVGF
jgi:hypothetical protein